MQEFDLIFQMSPRRGCLNKGYDVWNDIYFYLVCILTLSMQSSWHSDLKMIMIQLILSILIIFFLSKINYLCHLGKNSAIP